MAKKAKVSFVCEACGYDASKWHGRCPGCNAWNSFVEYKAPAGPKGNSGVSRRGRGEGLRQAVPITEVEMQDVARVPLGIGEFDRVLGGGVVPGGLVLIGGEPGVGKSTLLLTAAYRLAQAGQRTLYVSAEESAVQTKMRAERLDALDEKLLLLPETDMDVIWAAVEKERPRALIVDSVQTVFVPDVPSAPGSVNQVREVCSRLMQLAKVRGVSTFVVGHVTKDGAIAGPRTLEHMVDTVLQFESTRQGPYRVLRSHKNRFGSTNELAVFEMRGDGLREVDNPSAFFLAERPAGKPGSVVGSVIEGSRPVLVEVQGLCVEAPFGQPRRTTLGFDSTRCALLAAVLERACGLSVQGQDLFVNIAGGVQVNETAADLPVALSIASSLKNRPVDDGLVCFGEVGLSGEIRGVFRAEERLREIRDLGFSRALVPAAGADRLDVPDGLVLLPVKTLDEALEAAFD